ncbi:MAG: FAD/NAD(P)-binding protein [Acidimicrobiales bacterium]|nr:FAD/NAD(P)-binding protein [Acidimicrobiales bacterium]
MNAATATMESAVISDLLIPRPYRVIHKVDEIPEVVTLHVVPVDGELPQFAPAQVSMLGAFGVGEAAISVSSPVSNRDFHAYTIRRAGPISGALVDTPVGGVITIRGPFGNMWPLDSVTTPQLLVIGGGLGIAPLRAAIEAAAEQGGPIERLSVVYGAKDPSSLIFEADLDRWRNAGVEVALIVDEGSENWDGAVGVVPDLLESEDGVELDWTNTTAFICGPDIMMHFCALRLTELGVPEGRIWFTMERNMQCGNALCGHCQLGPFIVCRDGPVVNYQSIRPFHHVREL